jgi:uncharacterized protein
MSLSSIFGAKVSHMRAGARFSTHETSLSVGSLHVRHEGLRVVHLSDVHIGAFTPPSRIRNAISYINELSPDLVLMTGDYVTWAKGPVARVGKLLGGLQAPTYCVLGNHDHWVDAAGVRAQLTYAGYTVLQNEHRSFSLRGETLTLIGVDDQKTGNADVAKAFRDLPNTPGTRLVLAHMPNTAEDLPPNAGLACFSGHTHGGQIRVGSLTDRAAKVLGHPYVRGTHHVAGNSLYVSSGLAYGRGSILPRFQCPPEISLVTLTKGYSTS